MFLDDHVRLIQEQVGASAALGDKRTRQVAATLAATAEPAIRLALMGTLSAAADEVTAALLDRPDAPVISIRVDGAQVHVEVTPGAPAEPAPPAVRPADDGETSARISLRLSESLKSEVEAAAGRDGVSVNSWLIRAAAAALSSGPTGPADNASTATAASYRRVNDTHRITGWVNG
jgi:uncharacterized protein (DUF1778 family)